MEEIIETTKSEIEEVFILWFMNMFPKESRVVAEEESIDTTREFLTYLQKVQNSG